MGSTTNLYLSDGTPVTPALVGYESIGDVSGEGHLGFVPSGPEGEENNPTLYFEEGEAPAGDRLRAAASIAEGAIDVVEEADFDPETVAEYEEEYGEVPSIPAIINDLTTLTRHLALLAEVHEEVSDGE